jgi:hypothetical protein
MTTKFVTEEIERIIKTNVVEKTFPRLIKSHSDMLATHLNGVVQMLATCHDFYKDRDNFYFKLKQNSYKDLKWLLTYLIPYINQSKQSMAELTDLEQLYSLRYDKVSSNNRTLAIEKHIEDINLVAPKYVFSNIQYGRVKRGSYADKGAKAIKFNEKHIRDNYYLLLDTIRTTRYKMYINWIDILPYRIDNYNNTSLYVITAEKFNNNTFTIFDPVIDYPYEKNNDVEQIQILNDKLSGLNVEDIYNTISLDLYESIVKYKWIIFDVGVKLVSGKSHVYPLISILSFIIGLDKLLENVTWDVLEKNQKEKFIREWDRFVEAFERNIQISNESFVITAEWIKSIMKSIIVFFDRKYNNLGSIIKGKKYVYLNQSVVRDTIDDYDERMSNVTDDAVLKTVKSIDHMYIYDFISECLQGFKTTWYAQYLLSTDKLKINVIEGYKNIDKDKNINVTFKNVYNFCKSFVHEKRSVKKSQTTQENRENEWFSEEYVRLPETWAGLNKQKQEMILERLNDIDKSRKWFNIRINLFNTLREIDPSIDKLGKNINDVMRKIYEEIRSNMASILFETMITRGTMSYIVAENDITNTSMYDVTQPESKGKLIKTIAKRRFYKGNPYSENSFYYLTNNSFGKTGTYKMKVDGKIETYDYFRTCSSVDTAWYVSTTFHWIAQLGFCHKFINNRVNYVTGGTGAGKSTQVPKMYMYYLKAIDHIDDPTVIITVPRTNVATGVSDFVSRELALPLREIKNINGDDIEVATTNRYVQYKYQGDSNSDDGIYPKIRFITDGSVLQDAKDPFLKTKKIIDGKYVYTRTDKYNVVIVDEAHEHNTNMDMILSLMKNAAFYNNKLRFVIMSATMEADEPIYRRFYREVNDNRKYPLNNWIKQHKIDRINTERRFHISPPDETTRFRIDEYYRPGENADDIVVEIIKNSNIGDVLLFRPGTYDINLSVNYLNKKGVLPDDVIAFPYHAQLEDYQKKFLNGIAKNLKNIVIDKESNFSLSTLEQLNTNGKGIYRRCILVATNIAEASISIATLKYVVDTGLEKTMRYDFERRASVLTTNYITEASRIQRKGRVGRVAPGTVYYTYPKGHLESVVKQFNISVQDIHQSIYLELLRESLDVPIFTNMINGIVTGLGVNDEFALTSQFKDKYPAYEIDPITHKKIRLKLNVGQNGNIHQNENNIKILLNIDYKKHFTEHGVNIELKQNTKYVDAFIEGIINIVHDHYLSNGIFYDYYGSDDQYDYENDKLNIFDTKNNHKYRDNHNLMSFSGLVYFSGFDAKRLTDSIGNFYIIHPDELIIKRNIVGQVVDADQYGVITKKISDDNYVCEMRSNKIIVFWESLISKNLIGVGFMNNNKSNNTSSSERTFYKTMIGYLMQYCMKNLTNLDQSLINLLFYGYGLSKNDKEFEQILTIVAFLDTLGNKPFVRNLIAQETKYADPLTKTIDGLPVVDPRARKAIETKLRNSVAKTYDKNQIVQSDLDLVNNICDVIGEILEKKGIEQNLFKSSFLQSDKFLLDKDKAIDIIGIVTGLPKDLSKGTKKDIDTRLKILKQILNSHNKNVEIGIHKIKDLLIETGVNFQTVVEIIHQREEIRSLWNDIVYDLNNTGENKSVNIEELHKILKPHRDLMDSLNISIVKGALLLSKPYDIYKKIINSGNSYISLFNPHIENVLTLSQPLNSTFLDPSLYQDYVLPIMINSEYETMSCLTQIKSNDLMFVANIYNPTEMKRKFAKEMITSSKRRAHNKQYIEEVYPSYSSTTGNFQSKQSDITPGGIDLRKYYVPEHIISSTNINETIDRARSDIENLKKSGMWQISRNLHTEYEDYTKLLNN